MPMSARITSTAGQIYGRPSRGVVEHVEQRAINAAVLTVNEVDADGYIKPGVVFNRAGTMPVATEAAFGVTIEPIKIAKSNVAGDLTAAGTVQIGLQVIGIVNRKIAEDNLGRAYTAAEIASFDLAGSKLILVY